MSAPSPITVIRDGSRVEVKVDAHYVSDEEVEMVRRYVATLNDENERLRGLVRDMHKALFSLNLDHCQACPREDACVFMHRSFDCDECAFERDMRELVVAE